MMKSLLLAALFVAPALQAQKSQPAVLLELFTSEGCSSCPPADALLTQLNGTRTQDGRVVIVLSEHVTYWNQLGWHDPFSAQTFTDRQSQYSSRFSLDDVYTPQAVIDGRSQLVGSDRSGVLRALNASTGKPRPALAMEEVHAEAGNLKLNAKVGDVPDNMPYDLMLAIVDDTDRSEVPRGENAGRTLTHTNVIRQFERLGTFKGATTQMAEIKIPQGLQAHHHVILIAQSPNQGAVLAASTVSF